MKNYRTIYLAVLALMALAWQGQLWAADYADPNMPALEAEQLSEKVFINLRQDNYPLAIEMVKMAARKYPRDMGLRNAFAKLKKVDQLRSQLETESDLQEWFSICQYLRYFYLSQSLTQAALDIDQRAYAKDSSVSYAENLAESLVLCSKDQQASDLIESISEPSLRLQTLKLLILAREGQSRESLTLAQQLEIDYKHNPLAMFDLARISILAGDNDIWINSLIYAQRYSSESAINIVRKMIIECPEFKHLHNDPIFEQVMNTPSRIINGKCPASDNCKDCPGK